MKRKDDWIEELYIKEYINPLHRSGDSYWQDGKMVMTEEYHITLVELLIEVYAGIPIRSIPIKKTCFFI